MSTAALPDWVFPPFRGFTADDFFQLNDLPRHTELIDGSLIFVSPQEWWHLSVVDLLRSELDRQAPTDMRAIREMAVRLDNRQVPEPDVAVITAEAYDRMAARTGPSTYVYADDLVLAIEVVSPESEIRDRDTKPRKYAAAGIRHFWLVEEADADTVVYTHERNPATGTYVPTGIYHERLVSNAPFELDIDLTAVGRRPR